MPCRHVRFREPSPSPHSPLCSPPASAVAQPPGGFGGPRPEPEIEGIPRVPTAVVAAVVVSARDGPRRRRSTRRRRRRAGSTSRTSATKTTEYFVSGTAAGKPYTTRVVVRQPADDGEFSGLVLAESMHVSGAAHMFEFTSGYLMDSGHAAVEIVTTSPQQFVAFNAASLRAPEGRGRPAERDHRSSRRARCAAAKARSARCACARWSWAERR